MRLLRFRKCANRLAGSMQHGAVQFCPVDRKLRAAGADHGLLDNVLEFANIPGPVIMSQRVHGVAGYLLHSLVHEIRKAADKVMDQQWDVVPACAQRRKRDREYIQAIKEIAAKAAFRNHMRQILIRRCDDANVYPEGSCAAEPLELLFLEGPKDLRLQFQRHSPISSRNNVPE